MNFIFTNPSSVKSNIMFDVDIYIYKQNSTWDGPFNERVSTMSEVNDPFLAFIYFVFNFK